MPTDDEELEQLIATLEEGLKNLDPPSLGVLGNLELSSTFAPPHSIVIQTPEGEIIIKGNGEVTLPAGVNISEAAKRFWEAIHAYGSQKEQMLDNQVKALEKLVRELEAGIESRNQAICRLTAQLEDLKCNGQKHPDSNRFHDIIEEEDGGNKDH